MKPRKKINLVLWLAALMGVAVACHKDPIPEPTPTPGPTPTDTIPTTPTDTVPTNPDDTITPDSNMHKKIIVMWKWSREFVPHPDTIRYYANRDDVDSVIMVPDTLSSESNAQAMGFEPAYFHLAHQYLDEYIHYNPRKVKGGGNVYVNPVGGAHLPNDYDSDNEGMSTEDSLWFSQNGWHIKRPLPKTISWSKACELTNSR